ncbi:unnamed protein product, partial [Closterium sp. NIES-65]
GFEGREERGEGGAARVWAGTVPEAEGAARSERQGDMEGACCGASESSEALARLATHFARVGVRVCSDEWVMAEHVAAMHRAHAEKMYRPAFSRLHIVQNCGAANPKDPFFHAARRNTWASMLMAIPGVSARDAMTITRMYPSMHSLLSVYRSNLPERDKQLLLSKMVKIQLGNNTTTVGTANDACDDDAGDNATGDADVAVRGSQGGGGVAGMRRVERMGPVMSHRIYHVLTSNDASSMAIL